MNYRQLAEGHKDATRMIHYHGDKRRFTDSFGDSIHHNSIWIIGLHKIKALTKEDALEFVNAVDALEYNGEVLKHPLDRTPCTLDQYKPLLYALDVCRKFDVIRIAFLILRVYDHVETTFTLLPHYKAHFKRSIGERPGFLLACAAKVFEIGDRAIDRTNELLVKLKLMPRNRVDSSIVKNIVRDAVRNKASRRIPVVMPRYFGHQHATDHIVPAFIAIAWTVWENKG